MMIALKRISTALGLLALSAAPALAQGPAPSRNQATADAVAAMLAAPANQTGSRVSIETQDGLVTLSGTVPSSAVKADLVSRAARVAGVNTVNDRLQVSGDNRVRTAQYQPTQVAMGLGHHRFGGGGGNGDGGMIVDNGAETMNGAPGADGGPVPEGVAGGSAMGAANMPNYAWPSYAPYPNASAVGYPTAYPWQAWPNIGPVHPYPEVPLGWRAVTLRWDNGIWWLDFRKHYTRPFFTPYPFGILAY
jgi:BON domain